MAKAPKVKNQGSSKKKELTKDKLSAPAKVSPKAPFEAKDLLSLKNVTPEEIDYLFRLTDSIRKSPEKYWNKLQGKTLGLLFQKNSSRTRVSFEVGMAQLGGQAMFLSDSDIRMGRREPIKDVARTLSRYFDGIVLRTYSQAELVEFAGVSRVPVINGLSDAEHPCQILSDLYTIYTKFGKLKDINITYIGDSNNVLQSLIYGACSTGANLCIVSPRGYEPTEEALKEIKALSKDGGSKIIMTNNPFASLKSAHVIYTDVWVSMGQERERDQRLKDFQSFQVNDTIVSKALPDVLVMHCLPAHRGEEIADEVIEGPHSIVFEQAENKMHVQKALLLHLLSKKK